MTTPVIGVGAIGKGVITNLAQGGEELLIANRDALADGVKFAKAFNSLAAEPLAGAPKDPKVVIFYASDDESGEIDAEVERLISVAGFVPVKADSIDDASLRIEVLGDLHPFGGLNDVDPTVETAQDLLAE